MLEVYECGKTVKLKVGGSYGMITASINRFGSIRYEVTMHSGDVVNKHEKEFIVKSDKIKIGYIK